MAFSTFSFYSSASVVQLRETCHPFVENLGRKSIVDKSWKCYRLLDLTMLLAYSISWNDDGEIGWVAKVNQRDKKMYNVTVDKKREITSMALTIKKLNILGRRLSVRMKHRDMQKFATAQKKLRW